MSLFNHFLKRRRSVKSGRLSRRVQVHPWRMLLFFLIAAVAIPGAVAVVSAAPLYVPAFLATKVEALIGDDGDNQADPGETIEYTVAITNTGPDPATGVVYTDTIDSNTTLVGGSVAASPVGANDTFPVTVVGNVSINSATLSTPFSVTANDYLGLNPVATISSFQATTANGGQVVMTTSGPNMGRFTYDPPAGFEGVDTFTYTLADNPNAPSAAANRTATVSITVSGMVWFINNTAPACTAAGCGRLSNPFSTLAAFNGFNNGTGNNPAANDNIFIFESGTAYAGGVTLLSGQRLIGQDASQSLSTLTGLIPPTGSPSFPAMSPGGSATTIQNGAGNAVTLNEANTIRGLTISGTSGAGITGTGINNLTVGSDVSLTGVSGTDLNLNGGNGAVSFGASVTNTAGRSISIANRSGGTVNLTGPINDTGTGVLLDNNDNATVTIAGGLVVNSGTNAAFTATNGGTVQVCDENPCNPGATGALVNTLTTTTGTALNVANTTIGANNLEFRSISANGGANGIVLNTTGSSGGLVVKGDAGSSNNGSGGTLQNITTSAIQLISTQNVSLDQMNIQKMCCEITKKRVWSIRNQKN